LDIEPCLLRDSQPGFFFPFLEALLAQTAKPHPAAIRKIGFKPQRRFNRLLGQEERGYFPNGVLQQQ